MKKTAGLLLIALIAGCGLDSSLPQYMQDLPRTEEDTVKVCEEIRRELGEDTRVERVEDYFFVASNDTSQIPFSTPAMRRRSLSCMTTTVPSAVSCTSISA